MNLKVPKDKSKYIENLEPGLLIAYKDEKGLIKSGKVLAVGIRFVNVKEFNGENKDILKSSIIWVKTGQRWPKEIFKALRAGGKLEENKQTD